MCSMQVLHHTHILHVFLCIDVYIYTVYTYIDYLARYVVQLVWPMFLAGQSYLSGEAKHLDVGTDGGPFCR